MPNVPEPSAVRTALDEFTRVGQSAFLKKYGFGSRRHYAILDDIFLCDAKAVLGAAHGYQFPDFGPLLHTDFNGGLTGANRVLERLGFQVIDLRTWTTANERDLRERLWARLQAESERGGLDASALRSLGVYGGAQGVWVDKANRTGYLAPDGVAVGIRLKGKHYPDDLDSECVLYHYPSTNRSPSRDQGEIQAMKRTQETSLPIFVITEPEGKPKSRQVRLGWKLDHDDASQVSLISFDRDVANSYEQATSSDEAPFVPLQGRRRLSIPTARAARDPRFKFRVMKRYGGECPISGRDVVEMLQAAHVIPVEQGGTDDERNGLLLDAGLHLAFEAYLWAINPDTLRGETRPDGPRPQQMVMRNLDLSSLPSAPHIEAGGR